MGLVSLVAARAMGASEVWISARHSHQAELARSLGAARVLHESEASPAALGALGAATDIDLVVETVGGSADTLRAACHAIRPGGSVSVVGLGGTLAWSNCYHRSPGAVDFEDAIRILDAEREGLGSLVSHSVPLSEIDRAFDLAADKKAGTVKVSVIS